MKYLGDILDVINLLILNIRDSKSYKNKELKHVVKATITTVEFDYHEVVIYLYHGKRYFISTFDKSLIEEKNIHSIGDIKVYDFGMTSFQDRSSKDYGKYATDTEQLEFYHNLCYEILPKYTKTDS